MTEALLKDVQDARPGDLLGSLQERCSWLGLVLRVEPPCSAERALGIGPTATMLIHVIDEDMFTEARTTEVREVEINAHFSEGLDLILKR